MLPEPQQNVHRFYDAKEDFIVSPGNFQSIAPSAIKALGAVCNRCSVDPLKPYRTIWAFIGFDSAPLLFNFDLVCYYRGLEVYREVWGERRSTEGTSTYTSYYSHYTFDSASKNGANVESVSVRISTIDITVIPLYLNITCDTVGIYVNSLLSSADAERAWSYLFVRSGTGA